MNSMFLKICFSLVLFTVANLTSAQEMSFEQLDSTSTLISQLQKQTEGKTYKDVKGDSFELSYPEENFKVWYHDKLATHAVYKKRGDKEVLELTENIDFSMATGVYIANDHKGVVALNVSFPKGHLETQIIEQGSVISRVQPESLSFFCRYGAIDANKVFLFERMFFELYEIAARLKIEKGLTTEPEVVKEIADYASLNEKDFIKKYPLSMFAAQAREVILEKNRQYVLKFAEKYNYKPDLTLEEFAGLSPENRTYIDWKKTKTGTPRVDPGSGPYALREENGKVASYEILLCRKGRESVLMLNEILSELRQNIDAEFIRDSDSFKYGKWDFDYTVSVPGAPFSISLRGISGDFIISFY